MNPKETKQVVMATNSENNVYLWTLHWDWVVASYSPLLFFFAVYWVWVQLNLIRGQIIHPNICHYQWYYQKMQVSFWKMSQRWEEHHYRLDVEDRYARRQGPGNNNNNSDDDDDNNNKRTEWIYNVCSCVYSMYACECTCLFLFLFLCCVFRVCICTSATFCNPPCKFSHDFMRYLISYTTGKKVVNISKKSDSTAGRAWHVNIFNK